MIHFLELANNLGRGSHESRTQDGVSSCSRLAGGSIVIVGSYIE